MNPSAHPSSVASVPDFAKSIAAAVNSTRRTHGLRTLRLVLPLKTAALAHAQALAIAGQFTHSWPDGRSLRKWISFFYSPRGYRSWDVGENLLWSTPGFDASTVVARWLASPTHRRVMLTPRWRQLGLGVVAATAAPGVYDNSDVEIIAAEFGIRRK